VKPNKKNKSLLIFTHLQQDMTEFQKARTCAKGQNCKFAKLLLEGHIIVAGLSQNTEFMFWLCFVSLERTRPNDVEDCARANRLLMV
jgi:hypothetical protein